MFVSRDGPSGRHANRTNKETRSRTDDRSPPGGGSGCQRENPAQRPSSQADYKRDGAATGGSRTARLPTTERQQSNRRFAPRPARPPPTPALRIPLTADGRFARARAAAG